MPFLLLADGKLYDEPPESARLCRKFADVAGGRELYLTWHGKRLNRVAVYPLRQTGRALQDRSAVLSREDGEQAFQRALTRLAIPTAWTVADYAAVQRTATLENTEQATEAQDRWQ